MKFHQKIFKIGTLMIFIDFHLFGIKKLLKKNVLENIFIW